MEHLTAPARDDHEYVIGIRFKGRSVWVLKSAPGKGFQDAEVEMARLASQNRAAGAVFADGELVAYEDRR